jgi:hypothetical protein
MTTEERLVKVTAMHVVEKFMPVCVALNILEAEIKDKRVLIKSKKKLFKLIKDGLEQAAIGNLPYTAAALN